MKPSDWKSNWVGLAAGMRGGPKAVKIKTLQLGEKEAGAGCKPTIHISHEGRERIFFLTTPFIGSLIGVTGQPEVRRGAVNLTYNAHLAEVNPTGTF